MTDHLDRLVASGVITIEREPTTGVVRIRLTQSAWEQMSQATAHVVAHSPTTHIRADKQRTIQRRRDHERY